MSKYTTELRYICETQSGLSESVGYNDVNEIIGLARPKIFDFYYPIFDGNYKQVLETKILKHFYTREIGLETYGLWKLKLDTKLNEIMPYYNKLYLSELLEYNPLWTDDYKVTHNKGTDGTSVNVSDRNKNQNGTNVTVNNGTDTLNSVSRKRYSDTPQGALTDLENDKYLTNAEKTTSDSTETTKNDTNSANVNEEKEKTTNNNVFRNVEEYLESVQGRRGRDASELIIKYRETFLNIDMMIINDLEELFMHLW